MTEALPDPHDQSKEHVRAFAREAGFVEQDSSGTALLFTINFVKPG